MSIFGGSLLDVNRLTPESIEILFRRARQFRDHGYPFRNNSTKASTSGPLVALLFFEPSTRTQTSFAMAASRLDIDHVSLNNPSTSSISKGETLTDTVSNVAAMGPDALVVRFGEDEELANLLSTLPIPVISGGQGVNAHPTQALLDTFTIEETRGQIRGERVLIIGDVAHSRVAASNIQLLKILGAEVGVCGPQEFLKLPSPLQSQVEIFENVDTGLKWATVAMALRIQFERLADVDRSKILSREEYRSHFGLSESRLKNFGSQGIILHPGPINYGVELDKHVLKDKRCMVLRQVKNGVLIRAALFYEMLLTN